MKTKMLEALKKRYSNLGLSDDQFNLVVPMAVLGLADDADEASIEARASESYISDMLKNMQSQGDKIRTLEAKVGKPGKSNKGDDDDPGEPKGELAEVLKLLKEQKESNAAMQKRLEDLENAGKTKDFEALVGRVARDLHVPAALLDLFKDGLSSDMDEKAVKDAMGAKKKALVDQGVKFADGTQVDTAKAQTEAEAKEAADWVKGHAVK